MNPYQGPSIWREGHRLLVSQAWGLGDPLGFYFMFRTDGETRRGGKPKVWGVTSFEQKLNSMHGLTG